MYVFKEIKQKKEYDPDEMRKHSVEHFETPIGLETPKDLMKCPEYIKKLQDIPTDSIQCGPSSYEEIVSTIKNMRKKKASNDIPIELLQATIHSKELLKELHNKFKGVWDTKLFVSKSFYIAFKLSFRVELLKNSNVLEVFPKTGTLDF